MSLCVVSLMSSLSCDRSRILSIQRVSIWLPLKPFLLRIQIVRLVANVNIVQFLIVRNNTIRFGFCFVCLFVVELDWTGFSTFKFEMIFSCLQAVQELSDSGQQRRRRKRSSSFVVVSLNAKLTRATLFVLVDRNVMLDNTQTNKPA